MAYDQATQVTLECPRCRVYKTVPRPADVPFEVRLIEIICPDCDDGDRHSETWYSAPGVEVSQDPHAPDAAGLYHDRPVATSGNIIPGKSRLLKRK